MTERTDFHIRTKKELSNKARDISGFTNREIYELGCRVIIEENQNKIDAEILELHNLLDAVDDVTDSIKSRLMNKEIPSKPNYDKNDEKEIKRNIIPLELFKEIVVYYMDDYNITDIKDLNMKNKDLFRFVIINSSNHNFSIDDINKLYNSK